VRPVGGIAEMIVELLPEPSTGVVDLTVDHVMIDMPVEVRPLRGDDGPVRLEVSPPTQPFRTSVMPVLHRISLSAALIEEP
jgi:hypothetical protein